MSRFVNQFKDTTTEFLYRGGLISTAARRVYDSYYLAVEHLVPSRRYARSLDHEFDARFGVVTKARFRPQEMSVSNDNARFSTGYEATRPTWFKESLDSIELRHEDFVFVDFGSGMGRALLLAAEYPFKAIVGVEFSSELHGIAEENLIRYQSVTQKCADLKSICMDATQFPIPTEKAVFYFFNPFGAEIMKQVLTNIQASLAEFRREVYIVYVNPKAVDAFAGFNFKLMKARKGFAVFAT